MRIAIVTDAWRPQVNGVVTTLSRTAAELEAMGNDVLVINPQDFRTFPLPSYPEIRLAFRPGPEVRRRLEAFAPDHIHIATEGTLGLAARRYCLDAGKQFTTSYHTQYPEYVAERLPVPLGWTYALMRRFHNSAARTMVATPAMETLLRGHGINRLMRWERGVDTDLFAPLPEQPNDAARPVWIYVGRVAVEKNIEAFLRLDLPGRKQVVGDGPELTRLRALYPDVDFLGYRFGEELARIMASADVFVFPSVTDTYGLVMLEAMACGLPVAAFPVTGPIDVVKNGLTGVLDNDLRTAALGALRLNRKDCRAEALTRTWRRATEQFAGNLVRV